MSELASAESPRKKKSSYDLWRRAVLTGAFALVLINPFLNYYLNINFVQGWYQSLGVGDLWFVSPLEGLESLLVTRQFYLPSLIGMAVPVVLALLLGRVFCSWICPVSFFFEIIEWLRRAVFRRPFLRDRLAPARRMLWFALIAELLITMILGAPLFVFLSPPGLIGREIMTMVFFHSLAIEGVLLLLILAMELLARRFYCRSLCPLGGLLALIGNSRRLRVRLDEKACVSCGRCARACPMGLDPERHEALSAYCWNCGSCVDACMVKALDFHFGSRN